MAIREVDLPGVGKKYTLQTQAGEQVVVVLHRAGKRELYLFRAGEGTPAAVIDLSGEEAQQIGGILSRTYFQAAPDSRQELVMKELTIDWLPLPAGHLMLDRSIRDLAVRQQTGASIIAILREGKSVINPDPDEILRAGDTVMVIGNAGQVARFKETFHLDADASA